MSDLSSAYYLMTLVAEINSLSIDDLTGKRHNAPIVRARHIAIWLIRRNTKLSLKQIGKLFNRDHSTVLYAIRKIQFEIDDEAETKIIFNE